MLCHQKGDSIFRLLRKFVGVALVLAFGAGIVPLQAGPSGEFRSLTGQLLVAKPSMADPRFRQTVIFMARHDDSGAFGLVVNRTLGPLSFAELLTNMKADPDGVEGNIMVHFGGPVEPRRGFILHSADYTKSPLFAVNESYVVTFNSDIIRAIASGHGPARSILAIGYAGWGAGQLERELERKDWVVAPASDALMFGPDHKNKWKRAYDGRYLDI